MQSLLPSNLELLGTDYGQWSSGSGSAGGKLGGCWKAAHEAAAVVGWLQQQ
jgi:hypothetical protein